MTTSGMHAMTVYQRTRTILRGGIIEKEHDSSRLVGADGFEHFSGIRSMTRKLVKS